MSVQILWFRRDLRLHDHEALSVAAAAATRLVPLFIIDPLLVCSSRVGGARLAYLRAALDELDQALRVLGSRLITQRGDPREILPALAAAVGADAVHWSADHTPYAVARDRAVSAALTEAGVMVHAHPGVALQEPGSIRTQAGQPYKVFTPFHAAWRRQPFPAPRPAPSSLPPVGDLRAVDTPGPAELEAVAETRHAEIAHAETGLAGGESAARARLDRFIAERSDAYEKTRDLLAQDGTSRLSADLHYGCVSPREVHDRLDRRKPGHAAFSTELAWRDFYLHVMAAWPHVRDTELNPAYRSVPWRGEGADAEAWRAGQTGYPIVDAAQRQLLAQSWMPNRARMIVASFLCKHLLIDWRIGQAHFLRHLVDGDVASNNGGWQWAAGTGTDAQPYFRMFNPVTQGQRFDPEGRYVRRWLPELASVPDRWIHRPHEMPVEVAHDAGVRLGVDYPAPIVEHAQARREALAFFKAHTGG
jgi:deoxyribodipyrimidine photo-lyase